MRHRSTNVTRMAAWKAHDDACKRIIAAIPDTENPPADWPERIIEALRGMGGAAWITMDEHEGYRDLPDHFPLIRQTRNSPQYGPALIKAINEERP